jgi:MarR family transcriptional regulator, transcriptional regulator for hemolysin
MNERNAPLQDVIYFQLEQTIRMARAHSQKAFAAAGLTVTVEQWVLLKLIAQYPHISQQALAEKAIKDAASITRMLDSLQGHGLVQRLPAPDDRRKYLLALSEAGASLIEQHMDLIVELRAQGLQGFSQEEVHQLHDLLLRMQANLR